MMKVAAVVVFLTVGCTMDTSNLRVTSSAGGQLAGQAGTGGSISDGGSVLGGSIEAGQSAPPGPGSDAGPGLPDAVGALDAGSIASKTSDLARPIGDVLPDLVAVGAPDIVAIGASDHVAVGAPDLSSPVDVGTPDVVSPGLPDAGQSDTAPQGRTDVVSSSVVMFSDGEAVGAMTGPCWIVLGSVDTVTSPSCTRSGNSCSPAAWPATTSLCVTGTVPSVLNGDYTSNWGIAIGVSATQPPYGPIGTAYSTIIMNWTGTPASGLRMVVHVSGDPSTTTYCLDDVTAGKKYRLVDFNTECYGGTGGVELTAADAADIDQVELQVVPSTTAYDLKDLCLDSIVFGS